jgi:type IV pilus assembly protein PilB
MTAEEQAGVESAPKEEELAVIGLADKIIAAAIAERATDIHLDPERKGVKVRFRIDGVMHDILVMPKHLHAPVVGRFKLMADLDLQVRHSAQSGRILVTHEGREYDLREAVLPTVYGEKVTMRLLQAERDFMKFEELPYRESDRKRLLECLHSPTGLLVFSGPTGSGKKTAMYACMRERVSPEWNLLTIEDPVELPIPGVNQVQVNRKVGLTFANTLRHFLRHDPDIIMVAEVPDGETANLCLNAALTGHLVLTQLHVHQAELVVSRLIDMGADPYLVSESLLMASSQRLLRRICPKCAQEVKHPAALLAEWRKRAEAEGLSWPREAPVFRRGKGCENCRKTGYYNRTAIFEILVMDRELANLVSARAEPSEIRAAAIRKGMTTIFADGLTKAMAGETTVEEVLRVVGG